VPIETVTDENLVKNIQKGEKSLYSELIVRYQDKLLRYVRYLTNSSEYSDDIVQESFIKVYKNINSFKTEMKFSSWIYRIAHNETINRVKKINFGFLSFGDDLSEDLFPDSSNIEADYEKEETVKKIDFTLDKLPLKYRDALTLYYIEDKSYEEISDILRISVGTVGTLIRRGKKKMKDLLIKEGIGYAK